MKKRLMIMAAVTLTCWSMMGCSDAGNGDESSSDTVSTEAVTADTSSTGTIQSSTPPDSATVTFMKKAASGGVMEVQLGQIAQDQADNQRVKDFGAMMIRDHGKANDELKSIASAKNVNLSDSLMADHKKHVADMKKKKGSAFDKAYMSMMVKDHQKDIQEFEKASNNLSDGEVKAFATRTLPVLKTHLDSANAISKGKQ